MPGDGDIEAHPRTFLFADMRGWTRYTQEHGDEAASALAARFADLARETVPEFAGELLELTGDGMLSVFGSARQALRASVELQRRLRAATEDGQAFPLGVGMGLDAGEAVPTEGGYRGGALNLAARLCAIAKPGQILASESAVHLARRVEGLRFERRRAVRLKGIRGPVRLVEVVPEELLPPLPPPPARPAMGHRWRWGHGVVGLAMVVVVAGVAWAALSERGSSSSITPTIHANSLVSIDPRTDAVKGVARLALGGQPSRAAFGDGRVWTYNGDSQTIYGIDARTHTVETQGVGLSPSDITTSPGHVWITDPYENVLSDVNATSPNLQTRIPLGSRPTDPLFAYTGPFQLAADHQRIWVAHQTGFVVVDGNRDQVITPPDHRLPPGHLGPADVVLQGNQRWHAVYGHPPKVVEDSPQHASVPITQSETCCGDLAIGFGYTWYASGHHVWKISPAPVSVADVIAVREDAEAITTGAGSVWVADTAAGDVLKIDPTTDRVTRIRIGQPLGGITYGDGLVWVTAQGAG